jgi:hypothetical protein
MPRYLISLPDGRLTHIAFNPMGGPRPIGTGWCNRREPIPPEMNGEA